MPQDYVEYLHIFDAIKNICVDIDQPITPYLIEQWGRHIYRDFERWERHAILEMDAAFRRARMEVIKWHGKRPQIGKDRDEQRTSGGRRGNSRI